MDIGYLPPLFEMDNYEQCIKNDKYHYCDIQAKLNFNLHNETVEELYKNLTNDKLTFDRSVIHRAICLPQYESQDQLTLFISSSRMITETIKDYRLSVLVNDATCKENRAKATDHDQIVLVVLMIYFSIILLATYYGLVHDKKDYLKGFKKMFMKLSLISTWKTKTSVSFNKDHKQLLSMQGLRFFAVLILFYTHILFMYNASYISNPTYLEDMYVAPESKFMATHILFIVLIFFLFSSWLLAVQVYNIYDKHAELSLKHIGILIINRYFRLAVALAFSVILIRTSLLRNLVGPTNFSIILFNENACKTNWMATIFFVNNFQLIFDICNPVSWYLSADFQMYVVNLLLLYAKLKFKIKRVTFFTSMILISCTLHGVLLYINDVDIMFKPYLRNLELRNLKNSKTYMISYMSTISVWSSSWIGVIMGAIYHRTRDDIYRITWMRSFLWMFLFFGLPSLATLICHIEVEGLMAAILGSITKPIYTLGIGLGVWGMSHNYGGIIKNILENKWIVLLSNFIFCIYLLHTGIINVMHYSHFKPLEISNLLIIKDYCITVVLSFIFGILMTLTIEEPGLMLQKKYLPQLNKWISKSME